MKLPRRSQRRILAALVGFTLIVAALFSLYVIAFTYEVEDAFLNALLQEEADFQSARRRETGQWGPPRNQRIQLHDSPQTLPQPVRDMLQREPDRIEFPGDAGRYYHLLALKAEGGESGWLVLEVTDQLIVRPMRDSMLSLLAWSMLIFVTLAAISGYLISRGLTRRLSALADEVASIDLAKLSPNRPVTDVDDEVSVVAAGMASMTSRLREFVDRERSFTRDASHELRTPLAVIRSASDQLMREQELGPMARRHAALIADSTARLEYTVSTLLALAREEHFAAPASTVLLLPLIEQIVVDHSPRLQGKPVEVEVDVPNTASMHAPPAVLQILLANLVGNAFAHTEAGVVRIRVEEQSLCVRNPASGAAIPSPRETAPFQKGQDSDGFGLGLSIIQQLCVRYAIALSIEHHEGEWIARLRLAANEST